MKFSTSVIDTLKVPVIALGTGLARGVSLTCWKATATTTPRAKGYGCEALF